ncbi:MAG: short-chain dehydrogenase, partial [Bacteroidetes bacterium]
MQTVLITGASSGIGKELAYVFAKNNFNLILVARRAEKLDEIKNDILTQYKVEVHVITMDLSQLESANKLFKEVMTQKLNVDVLINNAGFGISAAFDKMDIEYEEQMLILNIITLTKLSRLFGNYMIPKKTGHIINIASTAAFQ